MELFQDSVDDTEEELHPEQILMHAEQTYRWKYILKAMRFIRNMILNVF
jgi:hypothetical protein